MDRRAEGDAAAVPGRAKQAAEAQGERGARWSWVEPTVWTERMLAALENGVKGGRWYSLMDKVYAERTLWAAWERVKRHRGSAGVDRQSVEAFEAQAGRYLAELHAALRAGTYRPQAVRRVWIAKRGRTGQRPLGIPTVKDRVVQTAMKLVLEPIWEAVFAEQSYGFRPGRGCKDALRRVQGLLNEGAVWVVDVDLEGYFDSIPHGALEEAVAERVADGEMLRLVGAYLRQGVLEGLTVWEPEAGTPQGAVLSPLLANIYLDPLDKRMAAQGWQMVRYADDLVVLCPSQAAAEAALAELRVWTTAQGLRVHAEKTRVVDARQRGGFEFLGYHFERGLRWPRRGSEGTFRAAIRTKTRRTTGTSLAMIVADVNRTVRGWFEYFKHSHWSTFARLDKWIRMRLRSILRHRQGRTGRGRGADHQRWPNTYFVKLGLFTMSTARVLAVQSR